VDREQSVLLKDEVELLFGKEEMRMHEVGTTSESAGGGTKGQLRVRNCHPPTYLRALAVGARGASLGGKGSCMNTQGSQP